MITTLTRFEWIEQPGPGIRLKFRKDGTGFYEREGAPGSRLVRDNLLWKLEESVLHLKFAHARLWTEVKAELHAGPVSGERLGESVLILARDPYASTVEDTPTGVLTLWSDSGAALLG